MSSHLLSLLPLSVLVGVHLTPPRLRTPPPPLAQIFEEVDTDFEDGGYAAANAREEPDWLFFDRARIFVAAGDGGNGCVAFRREKDKPKMGPCGVNGGRGVSVVLECVEGMNTLLEEVHFRATEWQGGMGARHGEAGATAPSACRRARSSATRRAAAGGRLVSHGGLRVARGGRGGRGAAFKTARDTTPRLSEMGEPGAERWLLLELKLLADVGLVGCPNASKSALLAAAAPKQGGRLPVHHRHPTRRRHAGEQARAAGDGMVLADIPGLLEGAHEGVGLGRAFLRHIERCRLIAHIVDSSSPDPVGDVQAVNTSSSSSRPSSPTSRRSSSSTSSTSPRWPRKDELLKARGGGEPGASSPSRRRAATASPRCRASTSYSPTRSSSRCRRRQRCAPSRRGRRRRRGERRGVRGRAGRARRVARDGRQDREGGVDELGLLRAQARCRTSR